MNSIDPRFDLNSINEFSSSVGRAEFRKGYKLFAHGAVVKIAVDPNMMWRYRAIVEDSGGPLDVTLRHDETLGWEGECECNREFDCKHCVAVLHAARQLPSQAQGTVVERAAPRLVSAKPKGVALPLSPLSGALEKALGRKLLPEEASYVLAIRRIRDAAGQGDFTKWHLVEVARLSGNSWDRVDLCPGQPTDDLQCWQYLARFIRQNGRSIPAFMEPVTDAGQIEALVARWEREKAIVRWRKLVGNAGHVAATTTDFLKAELRLRFRDEQADIEWQSGADGAFCKCRDKDMLAITAAFNDQTLSTSPETERLIMLTLSDLNGTSTSLSYLGDAKRLSRILCTPGLVSLTLSPSGAPFLRASERLLAECVPPEKAEGDYLIRLVLPDGKVPGPFMGILPGVSEWLYLTKDTVYRGPPHHGIGAEAQVQVPAEVIESRDGYRFFRAKQIPIPPRLAERVQLIKMIPTAACSVAQGADIRHTRVFHLKLTATAAGAPKAEFRNWQWVVPREGDSAKKTGDKIVMLDEDAMHRASESIRRLDLKWEEWHKVMCRRWPKAYPEWFGDWVRALPADFELQLDPELQSLLDEPISARLRLEMQESEVDWFDVKVVMDVSDTTLSQAEMDLLLKASGKPVFLPRVGAWKRLKTEWTDEDGKCLAKIGLSAADLSGEPHRVHVLQLADESAAKLLPSDHAEKIRRRLDELKTRVTPSVSPSITAELRPYQVAGFHFLAYLAENRFGGVLADDMGLGKTLQTLTWLAWLRVSKALPEGPLPSLVVCPKSVMENWHSEAERFFPSLRVALWAPAAGMDLTVVRSEADLVVMNYSQVRLLDPAALRSPWFAAVLDEAQGIKNPNSLTAQAARSLVATYRLALTGTPIENRLMDLWSIMAYAMPGALGNRTLFAKRFASQEDPLARGRLAARVRPFLIRRTKEEVAKDLPERVEEDMVCEMEGVQLSLYKAELKCAQQMLLGVKTQQEFNRDRFNFLTSLLRLRQICCHASLVGEQYQSIPSAKLESLLDLIEPLMEEGRKVLVFSQFVAMLNLVAKQLKEREWPHFMLTGQTENRGELVRSFQEFKGSAVFLLSLKAGGFGLNLTAANYVVLYDPWWNPAVERQAIDRTHRIGQTNPVNAYRLIAKNSIEQKIRRLQQKKSAMAEAVLGDERFGEALTLDDLRFILQD